MPACCLSRVKHVHMLNLYLHASVKVQQKFCSTEILILCSTQHNQQTHTHCSFDILKMDNKRIKFSPSSIEQIEEETMARLMSSDNRYEGASGLNHPVVVGTTRPEMGIVYAIDSIAHVAHFFVNYVDVSSYSFVDETPSTPLFTRVHMKYQEEPSSDERDATRKRIRRMRMTPTKLFF